MREDSGNGEARGWKGAAEASTLQRGTLIGLGRHGSLTSAISVGRGKGGGGARTARRARRTPPFRLHEIGVALGDASRGQPACQELHQNTGTWDTALRRGGGAEPGRDSALLRFAHYSEVGARARRGGGTAGAVPERRAMRHGRDTNLRTGAPCPNITNTASLHSTYTWAAQAGTKQDCSDDSATCLQDHTERAQRGSAAHRYKH
ncbi:hypothetical protein SKAU_G00105100 [Synaphobranchus kaupii]|uniref:Uncharacterized protein n=1 Tax=Synaphobranchus kaupii TaxID=118154 RepID=A0A9Q1FZJ6_SYNKA|nr:hypothetical protein SKAU_G00105100 [Synaphobranchus kaupii]